ncbi:MAG: hypothetical protein NZO58_07080, partial [Gemmataceae bacterium]|nr:hypothetical protein [Gemmataceae bacterium]
LDDSDLAPEDESGSQVVALDEEAADEAAETVAGDVADIEVEEVADEEVAEVDEEAPVGKERIVVKEKLIEPAPWGAFPTVFMLPCVVVMVVVGIMGFELIQSTSGYKPAGFLTRTIGDVVGMKTK